MNERYVVQCEYKDGKIFYWKFFNYGFASHYLSDDIDEAATFPSIASGTKKIKYIRTGIAQIYDNRKIQNDDSPQCFEIGDDKFEWNDITNFYVTKVSLIHKEQTEIK